MQWHTKTSKKFIKNGVERFLKDVIWATVYSLKIRHLKRITNRFPIWLHFTRSKVRVINHLEHVVLKLVVITFGAGEPFFCWAVLKPVSYNIGKFKRNICSQWFFPGKLFKVNLSNTKISHLFQSSNRYNKH